MIAALFTGSVLAYPVYALVNLVGEAAFRDIVIRTTQVAGLLFALAYLRRTRPLSWRNLGLRTDADNGTAELLQGFAGGVLIVTALITSLYLLDIHTFIPDRDYSIPALVLLLVKAVVTGLAVAAFEEILFRGALLGGLVERTRRTATAVLVISTVYAAVHFLDYPPLAPHEAIGWLTGPVRFGQVIAGMFDPVNLDTFLTLTMLGILLGMMRLRSDNILMCIGVHAGLIAMVKISRYFLSYQGGSGFDFLVGTHDHRLGYLAFLWLSIATLVYYVAVKMKDTENNKIPA